MYEVLKRVWKSVVKGDSVYLRCKRDGTLSFVMEESFI